MPAEWNERTVAHLLRRVGFSATQEDIKFYLGLGKEKSIDYLLNYEAIDDSEVEKIIEQSKLNLEKLIGIAVEWLIRMVYTKRPLQEKMTLFWHGHFATAFYKVNEARLMRNQISMLRRLALGNFEQLLLEVSKDPAMILWLDNNTNTKGNPNENYARELLELFSMGVGTYTEEDVKEVARAFTGWTVNRRNNYAFTFDERKHDFGQKTILGQTGPFNGDDVVRIVAAQEATSRFIPKKLFEFFVYPSPKSSTIDRLSQTYKSSNYSIKEVMRAILTSEEFYSQKAFYALVKSPIEYVVGTLRMLKAKLATGNAGELGLRDIFTTLSAQGQILYSPPSVKGWDPGLAWINTATLLERYNYANSLVTNRSQRGSSIDPKALLAGAEVQTSKQVVDYFLKLLGIYDADETTRNQLKKYLEQNDDGTKGKFTLNHETIDKKIRGLIHLILSLPDYQLN
ncbi:MAG: DUF1800 domain-containing protein [Acidobacteriota bacterium]|nr:DUF1800 domain-containing protein [Blastocatellia bacterium]MDW8413380.1 DUF1800 domain-containing protein [Acidobacteriota bacterium]